MFCLKAFLMPDQGKNTDYFPRNRALPPQSPRYWVEQKDRYLRQLLIGDIEAITGRRLLVYFGNRFSQAQIDHHDITYFVELFRGLSGQPIDFMIETNGGFTDATEGLTSFLREVTPDLRTIVINAAKSNGTLLCLASREILMGASSELGPIEPHIGDYPASWLNDDDVRNENLFLHKAGYFALLQTRQLAWKLLSTGMMKGRRDEDVAATVEKLASRNDYASHGSVIDHREAAKLGLNISYQPLDDLLWQHLWLLYSMYDFDIRRDGLLKIFESSGVSTAIAAQPKSS
jgi:hypothetical protein